MKKIFALFIIIFFVGINNSLFAQSPQGRQWGFGIVLGDPAGLTAKYWTNSENAFVFDLGSSYFGSPRLGADYLWHFDAFHSNVAKLYAGPGVAIGFGKGHGFYYNQDNGFYVRESGAGLGVRGIFGVNIIPRNSPLEIFFEAGLLIGFTPDFGSAADAAIGIRFYPQL